MQSLKLFLYGKNTNGVRIFFSHARQVDHKLKKPKRTQKNPKEEFAALLVNIGLPEGFAGALADAEDHASRGWLEDNSQTLSQLLGRNTTPLSKSISEALQ
ncbi:hypothetical protein [Neptunomonas marina]|uniref:Uncharacterized protein n=1 Tax=Neptunomonas marina TaxID=1815562 RepID=A0A437Q8K4_9GAMM|nr:hypothetical protein [Neptunomonas marina]RVU30891.1 hypothetical protein EOE65_07695 [Neptunomonas marina]